MSNSTMFARKLVIAKLCLTAILLTTILPGSNSSLASSPVNPTSQLYKPTKEDLAHGKSQTKRMLHDLPAMRQWLTKNNPFYDFAIQHYAADAQGRRIYWVPFREDGWKTRGANAVSVTARGEYCGSISISKFDFQTKKRLSPENLWACLVFEGFNTFDGDRFNTIKSDGIQGKLSREQFILRSSEDEYLNAKETNRFYLTKVIPWSKKTGIKTNGIYWYQNIPPTFEQDMKYYQDRSKYPWSFFGAYYDNFIAKEQKKSRVNLK